MLIIEHIKMDIKSLEIKTKINYNWDDIIYINDFNVDLQNQKLVLIFIILDMIIILINPLYLFLVV